MYAVVQMGSTIFRSECLTTRSVVCATTGAARARAQQARTRWRKRENIWRLLTIRAKRSAHDTSCRIDGREPRRAHFDRLGRGKCKVFAKARRDDLHANRQPF